MSQYLSPAFPYSSYCPFSFGLCDVKLKVACLKVSIWLFLPPEKNPKSSLSLFLEMLHFLTY